MLVGISGCAHWFGFLKGNSLQCLSTNGGAKVFGEVRVEQLSLCSQVQLLAFGVPYISALAGFTRSLSQAGKIGRVLTISNVGNVTFTMDSPLRAALWACSFL